MKPRLFYCFVSLFVAGVSTVFAAPDKPVTVETLLEEMADRSVHARLHEPSYICRQFSSYDRRSTLKDGPDWFANDDWSMFIRAEERDGHRELVMMDTEGPGCIVRFWMTFAGEDCGRGTLRIYIDDYTSPAIEASAFDVLSGGLIAQAPLSSSVSELNPYERRGHNLYFPIPYAVRCKVTYESDNVYYGDEFSKRKGTENVYYNINYRTYPASTPVESFGMPLLEKYGSTISRVQREMSLKGDLPDSKKWRRDKFDGRSIKSGDSQSIVLKGPRAIRQLTLKLDSPDMGDALRRTVMELNFDGEKTAWVPVGDFYGIGYRPARTRTWYTCVDENNTMSAFWVMPFERECIVTLHNLGSHEVTLTDFEICHEKWEWDDRSMHFGASWHQLTNVQTGYNNETRPQDINFTTLKGKGVYVGDGVTLYNTVNGWWGEGDEKIYVDGETFPSHFGTGTEDYYGYAWCRPENFTGHPFISQPDGSGNLSAGYTVNTRTRALDAIPFDRSIVVDMEIWHWQQANLNYAPVSMWYMRPGGICAIEEDREGIRAKLACKRSDVVPSEIEFSIEGENMEIVRAETGRCYYQTRGGLLWDNCGQVFWLDADPGSKLELSFRSDLEASVGIDALCTMASDYGVVNLYLNGTRIAHKLNLYTGELKVCKHELGTAMLNKGINHFTIEIVSPAPDMQKGAAGIDKLFFRIVPPSL